MVNKLIPALVSLCLFVLISFSSSAQFGCLDFSWELNGNECGLTNFEVTGNLGSSQLSVLISGPNTTDVLDIGQEQDFSYSFSTAGTYIITVSGIEDCEDFTTFSFPLTVPECENCVQDIYWNEIECGFVVFEVGSFQNIEFATWDFGDGTNSGDFAQHYIEHDYAEPGLYEVCVGYYNLECENSDPWITECFTIEVTGCEEECQQEVAVENLECGSFYFEIGSDWSLEFATWDFGDGTLAETPFNSNLAVEHTYTASGTYEVCVEYYVLACNDVYSTCFTIDVEVCEEECEQEVAVENLECGSFYFEIGNDWSLEFATWDFGDGTVVETPFNSNLAVEHTYTASGTYEVCVEYYVLACNDVYTTCFTIDVEVCDNGCEEDLYWNEMECSVLEFEIGTANTVSNVVWDFGDGVTTTDENYITHIYEFPGQYQVCCSYYSIECDEFYTLCDWVFVEGCYQCEPIMTFYESDCGVYEFYITGIDQVYDIWWDFGDGTSEQTFEPYVIHTFEENGVYTVCPFIWTEFCPELGDCCVDVVVDCIDESSCSCDGENQINNGDFENGFEVSSDLFIDCTCQAESVCIASNGRDKCDNGFWLINLWDHTYGTEDGHFLVVDGVNSGSAVIWSNEVIINQGETYNFSFWQIREISDNANNNSTQQFNVVVNGNVINTINTASESSTDWIQYCSEFTAETSGLVTVAIQQTGGSGFNDYGIDDISFSSCGTVEPVCPEITVLETDVCGVYDFTYTGEINGNSYCWEIWSDGVMITTYFDEATTTYNFTQAGTYTITVTNAILCPGMESIDVTIEVPACSGDCNVAVGGIQLDCTTAELVVYAEFEITEVHWLIDGELIVGQNNFIYEFNSPETHYIEIAYIGGYECNDLLEGWLIPIFLDNSFCQEGCDLNIQTEQAEDNIYVFTGIPSDPEAQIFWEIEGELIQGNTITYEFLEPGDYSVCAFYETPDCPWGVETCTTIYITPSDCPEITVTELDECGSYEMFFDGYITGNSYCWDIWGDNYYNSYFDGQTTDVQFTEPGTYYVTVTNALLCEGITSYQIEIVVPECDPECELEFFYTQLDCNVLQFYFPFEVSQYYLDYGDGQFSNGGGGLELTHEYEQAGIYTACVEYYDITCEQWLGGCIDVYVEDCGQDCNYEVWYDALGDNDYVFYAEHQNPDTYTAWYVDGEYYDSNPLTFSFDEVGEHQVCAIFESGDCGVQEECFTISVMDEEECEGVTLSLEGLLDIDQSWLQVIGCALSQDGIIMWEDYLTLSNLNTTEEIDLCLPVGCYEFTVTNADVVVLTSLAIALQSADLGEIEIDVNLDILANEFSASFGVGVDCTTGIEEISSDVLMYPIPASDQVSIEFGSTNWTYQILDATGRLVESGVTSATTEVLDVTSWSNGLYLLKAGNDGEQIIKKFKVLH